MSFLSYGEFPSQQCSDKEHPSTGVSQFKVPWRLQSGTLLEQGQDQHFFTQGSTSSGGVLQFKAPRRLQPSPLEYQDQSYATLGASPFNGALPGHVTTPSQSLIQQPENRSEQNGYHSPSGKYLSNAALPPSGPAMSLPRVQALPSVVAQNTSLAGGPVTHKSSILTAYPGNIPAYQCIGVSVPRSSLEARRQGLFSQSLRESDRTWQPAIPRTEPLVRPEAPRKTRAYVVIKVILTGGAGLLVGGIASYWLLHFPTYLVVTWAILILILSNLVGWELRSYYLFKTAALRVEAEHSSAASTSHSMDMECHSALKDISDTTGYLKALCLVVKPGHLAENFPAQKEYGA